MMNLGVRRRDVDYIINDDPWDVTVTREGRTHDDAATSFTCVGRIQPSGARGTPWEAFPRDTVGEASSSRYGWLLLAPWDTSAFTQNDQIVAVQRSTSITRYFRVVYSGRYAYKYEVILDERQ